MPTTIKLKNSVTTTNTPTSLAQGEVAINITDKKVWVGNAATTPIQLLGAGGSASFGALTCTSLTNSGLTSGRVTYASTGGLLTDSANMTFNGTTLTVADLTDSSLTANRVVYATTAGNLTTSANFTFNGTTFTAVNDASISGLTVGKGGGASSTNTVVGNNALTSNTTGTSNSVLGINAMAANLGGSSNSAFGTNALTANTSGDSSSAFGVASLRFNTTGANNVAVGASALYSNTTASNNTAVGYQAGYSGTTFGSNAGFNTFLGSGAGYACTGSSNVLIGANAGVALTSGQGNLIIGGNLNGAAGGAMTTGSKNTLIGSFSGNQGGLDIRTASNYIVLSDGDGNPRGVFDGSGNFIVGGTGITSSEKLGVQQSANSQVLTIRASNASYTNDAFIIYTDRNTTNNSYYVISYFNLTAGAYKFRVADSGNVTNTNGSYGTISDIKNKENIVDATPKLDKLKQLQVRNFNFKGDDLKQIGFIAQEFEQVFPSMVEEHKDTDAEGNDLATTTKSIKTSVLVPILVKAVQELTAKVEALEAQLNK